MVKNGKKRTVSESETAVKVEQETNNVNRAQKKKKVDNAAAQNGQTIKQIKAEKKNVESSPDSNKKAQQAKQREAFREKRKLARKNKTAHGLKADLSAEVLKQKIKSIEERAELTKTAKRKLAMLRKLLLVKEGGTVVATEKVSKKQPVKVKNEKSAEVAKKKQVQTNEAQKKKSPEKADAKSNKKKDAKQGSLLLLKPKTEVEEDEEEDDEDSDEDEIDVDDDVSEEEDDSELEGEEDEDDDEEEDEDEEEEEDDEDDEDDEEEEEEEEDDKVKVNTAQSQKATGKPQQNKEQEAKKKRYVLFVGNLPFSITEEELKKHFSTKASQIVDIRIPKKDNTNLSRGFAYVELGNNTDYEKALSLNHSFVKGRRINVQYSGSNDKKEAVAKNQKLQALQKAGKLAGGQNKKFQRPAGKQGGGKPYVQKTKT